MESPSPERTECYNKILEIKVKDSGEFSEVCTDDKMFNKLIFL